MTRLIADNKHTLHIIWYMTTLHAVMGPGANPHVLQVIEAQTNRRMCPQDKVPNVIMGTGCVQYLWVVVQEKEGEQGKS